MGRVRQMAKATPEERRELLDAGFETPKPPKSETPNTNGRFNTIEGNAYYARNNRTGFQFSNRMKLSDKLSLTLMGDFQNEKLTSRNDFSDELERGGYDKYREELENSTIRANYELNQYGVPRNGKRREYNLGFNFRYEPFRWLTLTAGGRYTNFQLQDKSKRLESGTYKTGYPLEMNRGIKYSIGRVATPQEYADYKAIDDALANGSLDYALYMADEYSEQRKKHKQISLSSFQVNSQFIPTLTVEREKWVNPNEKVDFYWLKDDKGRLNMKDHPLTNGSIPDLHAQVPNPVYDPTIPDSPQFVPKYYGVDGAVYTTPMTEAERQRAMKQKGSGWVPVFSATVHFTDFSRVYLRYTETLRYPSIFEGTYGFSTAAGSFNRMGYGWRPEHAKNWEVGYIHDLTGLLPKMKKVDFRINYFHNKTENVIDRDDNLEFEQFDR